MQVISIKTITLENFKGIRSLTIDFDGRDADISGRNATGKTTIFDAISWLLFGKDSEDRKVFDIKTYDGDGNIIPDIPHYVEAVICANGVEHTLRREFVEVWQTRRGTTLRELTRHEERRLFNGVACTVREWAERIEDMCPERYFRLLSNPFAFNAMKTEAKRAILMEMCGEEPLEDIAAGNKDFETLLSAMQGKSPQVYRAEIMAEKKRLRAEIGDLPSRIDERKRDIKSLQAIDFAGKRKRREALLKSVGEKEACLRDGSRMTEMVEKERAAKVRAVSRAMSKVDAVAAEVKARYAAEGNKRAERLSEIESHLRTLSTRAKGMGTDLEMMQSDLKDCKEYKEQMAEEWKEFCDAQDAAISGDNLICPTCGHVFAGEEAEARRSCLLSALTAERESKLDGLRKRGQANDERIKSICVQVDGAKAQLARIDEEANKLEAELSALRDAPQVSAEDMLKEDAAYKTSVAALDEARAALDAFEAEHKDDVEGGIDDSMRAAIEAEVSSLRSIIYECDADIAKEPVLKSDLARVAELEAAYKEAAQKVAGVERMESVLSDFNRTRIERIEGRMNGLFSLTRFRLFDTQVNGAEVETCDAMVGGVPYASLNNAMRVNCGLDIIETLSAHLGISVPIVIDNAESINHIEETHGQQIRLYVSDDPELRITLH